MPQYVYKLIDEQKTKLELPDAHEELMPGVYWGAVDQIFTPAFWAGQYWLSPYLTTGYGQKFGETLKEEVVACLLGGYGVSSEVAFAAFQLLKSEGLFSMPSPSTRDILKILSIPMVINGRQVHYRFPKQKSEYICDFLQSSIELRLFDMSHLQFRSWLLQFKGIGPKIASWITRNWFNSDQVAILDIHIYRAGLLAGIFPENVSVSQYYFKLEDRFLEFASCLGIKPSLLDILIWSQMKLAGRFPLTFLKS